MAHDWIKDFPGEILVCDTEGVILEMNALAIRNRESVGGASLVGSNMLNCHSEATRPRITSMLEEARRNIYTIERNGIHKLIYQTPWYSDGQYAGFVEFILDIPAEMPHFIRG